ncbi:MAG: hypothetical protein ACRYHQ_32320 [Janthinobacterium lividum]
MRSPESHARQAEHKIAVYGRDKPWAYTANVYGLRPLWYGDVTCTVRYRFENVASAVAAAGQRDQ